VSLRPPSRRFLPILPSSITLDHYSISVQSTYRLPPVPTRRSTRSTRILLFSFPRVKSTLRSYNSRSLFPPRFRPSTIFHFGSLDLIFFSYPYALLALHDHLLLSFPPSPIVPTVFLLSVHVTSGAFLFMPGQTPNLPPVEAFQSFNQFKALRSRIVSVVA